MLSDLVLLLPMLLFSNVDNSIETKIINTVLHIEGDSALTYDHGKPTRYGIAQYYNPTIDVLNLTRAEAVAFYRAEYKAWRIDEYPANLRLVIFDTFVNHGVSGGKIILSKCSIPLTQEKILKQREFTYREKTSKFPNNQKNLQGWLNRLDKLRKVDIP